MRRSLAWLAGFLLLGLAAMLGLGAALFPAALHGRVLLTIAGLGLETGLSLFAALWCFALLPGARRPPGAAQPFGLAQGLWGMLGFFRP
ncbi:MAG: hypothetical protein B7Z80_23715 [Rhodospirillales bacterium 20-64-7]|nr:MAG: hypothetical protein B7Z80_23715 [Rhodospirillales bacterium 20-64-7]